MVCKTKLWRSWLKPWQPTLHPPSSAVPCKLWVVVGVVFVCSVVSVFVVCGVVVVGVFVVGGVVVAVVVVGVVVVGSVLDVGVVLLLFIFLFRCCGCGVIFIVFVTNVRAGIQLFGLCCVI